MRAVSLLLLALVLSAQAPPSPAPPPPPPEAPAPPPPVPDGEWTDLDEYRPSSDDIDPDALPRSTDTLRARAVPPVVERYRADPDFQYDTPQAKGPSLWDRFKRWWVDTFLRPIAENTTWGFWQVVLVVLAVLALGWVIARLVSAEGGGLFNPRPSGSATPLLDVEDIAQVDLGTRLRDALGRGDLRQAVRLRYLLVLQALDGADVLTWRRDKTNRQYVAEVGAARADLAEPFRSVTRAFDAVWYGERPVSPSLYGRLETLFDQAAP